VSEVWGERGSVRDALLRWCPGVTEYSSVSASTVSPPSEFGSGMSGCLRWRALHECGDAPCRARGADDRRRGGPGLSWPKVCVAHYTSSGASRWPICRHTRERRGRRDE
jgi:hypothetical protein